MMNALATRLRSLEEDGVELEARPLPQMVEPPADLLVGIAGDRLRRGLVALVAVLVAATFVAQICRWQGRALGLARFFDADVKVNFPTGFKVFALAACALLSWLVGRAGALRGERFARAWTHLAVVMAFLTIDEMAYVHQSLASFLDDHVSTSGVLHYAWVLIYLPFAGLVAVRFIPFLFEMRRDLRVRLISAGILFGGGSAGIELIKGHLATTEGETSLRYLLSTAVSDSLEMVGLAIFICAVFGELHRLAPRLSVRLAPSTAGSR